MLQRWRGLLPATGRLFPPRYFVLRRFALCAALVPAVVALAFDLCLWILAALLAAWSLADRDRATREDVGALGAIGTGQDLVAFEIVQDCCQGVETEGHCVRGR